MRFFNSLSRALGFGHDDEDDDIYTDAPTGTETDTGDTGSTTVPEKTASITEAAPETPAVPDLEFNPAIAGAIFDRVLEVFNATLPDFLQKSIDPEAQRRVLADALDESIKQYMGSLGSQAERVAESRLRNASDAARNESERLRKEMERLEQQKTSIREQQLSADRRRRALQDRVKDLEEQVNSLEAEREQFQLENRSLLNKIKLADVQPGVIDELKQEIERLRTQQNQGVEAPAGELEKLQSLCNEKDADLEQKKSEIEALKARVAELETHEEDVNAAVELSKQMYTQIQENLTGEREQRVNAETELESVKAELAQCNAKLAESAGVTESLKELESQLSKVEAVISKRDERIAALKAKNKKLKEELSVAREQAMRTNDTGTGLFALADAEQLAGDDDFECPDWFVSEPGPDTPPLHPVNTDFGYVEPPRKPKAPENDAQMSLF